jgi:putative NADPH-quinone reductase
LLHNQNRKEMITVVTFGRNRFKFQKLFPEAIFEGYEYNIKYCHFTFKNKISMASIKRICQSEKINAEISGPKTSEIV